VEVDWSLPLQAAFALGHPVRVIENLGPTEIVWVEVCHGRFAYNYEGTPIDGGFGPITNTDFSKRFIEFVENTFAPVNPEAGMEGLGDDHQLTITVSWFRDLYKHAQRDAS
jgi:hypothetical protein